MSNPSYETHEQKALSACGEARGEPGSSLESLRASLAADRAEIGRTMDMAHLSERSGDLQGSEGLKGKAAALRASLEPKARELARRETWRSAAASIGLAWVRDATVETIESRIRHPSLLKAAQQLGPSPRGLMLLGPTGCGKSTAAARAVWGAAQIARLTLCWATEIQLLAAVKETRLGAGSPRLIQRAKQSTILVLDDLGLGGRDIDGTVHSIADARYAGGRLTITTSGLTLDQLGDRYGRATIRRLLEFRGRTGGVVDAFPKSGR